MRPAKPPGQADRTGQVSGPSVGWRHAPDSPNIGRRPG